MKYHLQLNVLAQLRIAVFSLMTLNIYPAISGEGHDHGEQAQAQNSNGPQRQPDGSVFLPKPAQRQLGIRTLTTVSGDLSRSFELNARVVMDPNAGGKVQALNSGRIQAGPRGLPNPGQTVRKGEVLAYVVSSTTALEKSAQAAQIVELEAAKQLAEKRFARLKELSDTVPRKEVEIAESETRSLSARIAALTTAVSPREALLAPVTGVISMANVVLGQVVDARELVFEIVDPQRLRIEALAFDPSLATNIESASLAVGSQRIELVFIGAPSSLREQAQPLIFRTKSQAPTGLAVGQPVRIYVLTKDKIKGISLPVSTVLKSSSNQTIVWVKTDPERFEPRTVTVEPLDGIRVGVTSGLKTGDRVADQGATLINQIR